ncbi:hypothetical protein ZWY2020_052964 [Hordeum vulgare]|nr:hypothetical protein ZWY2020_052964 [Hordeum vulgare]
MVFFEFSIQSVGQAGRRGSQQSSLVVLAASKRLRWGRCYSPAPVRYKFIVMVAGHRAISQGVQLAGFLCRLRRRSLEVQRVLVIGLDLARLLHAGSSSGSLYRAGSSNAGSDIQPTPSEPSRNRRENEQEEAEEERAIFHK